MRIFLLSIIAFFSTAIHLRAYEVSEVTSDEMVRVVHYGIDDGLLDDKVYCAIQDKFGFCWFATNDGLVRFDGSVFKTYKGRVGDDCLLTTNKINYIGEDSNSDILCFSGNEVFRFVRETETFVRTTDSITDTRHISDNNKKVLSNLRKLNIYDDANFKVRLIDNQGGFWVNSDRGLDRISYVKPKVRARKVSNESSEIVRGLFVDTKRRIWISDKNDYVLVYDSLGGQPKYLGRNGKLYTSISRFGSDVYEIFEDNLGRIWLGTKPDGLFLLTPDGDSFNVRHFVNDINDPYSLNGRSIYAIISDSQNRLLVATYDGGLNIVVEDPDGKISFINNNNRIKNYPTLALRIRNMDINNVDVLALGTDDGLFTVDLKMKPEDMVFYRNVRRLNDNTSLGTNTIQDVLFAPDGSLLVATNGGGIAKSVSNDFLSDDIRFKSYTSDSGLATDVYLSFVVDQSNHLWAVGKNTLTEMNLEGSYIVNYQKSLDNACLPLSEVRPLCLEDNSLLIGTNMGYLHLTAQNISKSDFVPTIYFDHGDEIKLEPGTGHVRIEFSAVDLNCNETKVYKYLLDGIDDEWHYTESNVIDYTNFPIGTYRLRVASTNGDGVWTDNEQSIIISRPATFHESWYSWMLYGVLCSLLLFAIYRTSIYAFRLRQKMHKLRHETDLQIDLLDNRIKELVNANSDIAPTPDVQDSESARFANRAKEFVIANISNVDIDVDEFALYMNVSTSRLYSLFKKYLGYTPNKYIQNVRIKYAAKIISMEPETSIADVAYRSGFSDPKYFSRCFKSLMGCRPSDYKGEEMADNM